MRFFFSPDQSSPNLRHFWRKNPANTQFFFAKKSRVRCENRLGFLAIQKVDPTFECQYKKFGSREKFLRFGAKALFRSVVRRLTRRGVLQGNRGVISGAFSHPQDPISSPELKLSRVCCT
jgi:hypothetical protein